MSLPGNGIFVVQGEMAMLVTAMRRSTRWGSHSFPNEEYDVLMRTFQDLKIIVNQVEDLRLLDPATYLSPFLEVIRSKDTTGPVTSLALSAIHKFLSYGLIDPTHPSVPATVEDIADAVTHARFVGTDHSSDGVVLMKILQVLRTLMLSPEGSMLTDESVCEIMLSCFRICFETRLTELLRRNAEQCLRDMTQLIFMRLPQFPPEDAAAAYTGVGFSLKRREKGAKMKMKALMMHANSAESKSSSEQANNETDPPPKKPEVAPPRYRENKSTINEAEITIEPAEPIKCTGKAHARHSSMDLANENPSITRLLEKCVSADGAAGTDSADDAGGGEVGAESAEEVAVPAEEVTEKEESPDVASADPPSDGNEKLEEYVNERGVRFTPQEEATELQPYGLVCVRELFRFLISLCNRLDSQNTPAMLHLGLSLVGTALEVGADQLAKYPSLLYLVKDPLCWNLLNLLSTDRISIFALDLQISFLLFEALRFHLKYQMEAYFKKILELISVDTTNAAYEIKEFHHLALESLSQMFRIPGLCTEMYLNFDCDIYCSNIFEELTKLLSKNVVSSTDYHTHTLSLDVILTIIEAIEMGTSQKETKGDEVANVEEDPVCSDLYGRGGHVSLELGGMDDASVLSDHVTHDISQYFGCGRTGRHKPSAELPTEAELDNIKNMKKWVTQGTQLFNQKPERGIEFLQEHGVLSTPLDPHEVAIFLRENPDLDKKMIGEYICKRSSRGEDVDHESPSVLTAFAQSFDYTGLRIDQALRLYLETFRLPGEAPLIFLVMEKFAERWHSTNGAPFANTDATFRLAYAVIMLNMDQHNHNARKLNVPMTAEDFVRNLRGCNGTGDFSQPMLEAVFHSIKNEEMVMPAERVGPVRDAYLWRVLQRRGRTARYRMAPPRAHRAHHARLLPVACPLAVTALSAAFERAPAPTPDELEANAREGAALIALGGLERCAALAARLPPDALSVDALLLTLCKFTGLLAPQNTTYIAIGVYLGQSGKAQLALRRACAVAARHGDCVRASWRHLLEIVRTLYLGRLLPKCLMEAEDYLAPGGTVPLVREPPRGPDSGLLSSLYSYIALGESGVRTPSPHERTLMEAAAACVARCAVPALLVTETKFLPLDSLQELVHAMVTIGAPPDAESAQQNPQLEDIVIFFLELLGQTLIQNRDRLLSVWEEAAPHIETVVLWAGARGLVPLRRAVTALLRTAARLMRCELCAPRVLHHLQLLYRLPYKLFYQQADVISCGLYELVKTSAQNVHSGEDWALLLALLVAAGAGAWPGGAPAALGSASSRSEGSEDEAERRPTSASSDNELSHSPPAQGWILVQKEHSAGWSSLLALEPDAVALRAHRPAALARCAEALALVVRDVAHVTPHNCRAATRALRLLARATLRPSKSDKEREGSGRGARRRGDDESSDEELDADQEHYHNVSIQLLDLMHTLHSRTAQIFKWWRDESDQGHGAEDYDLWEVAWRPLLQGIAEFCTDKRRMVSNSAILYLQRALLAPALGALGAAGWEACFEHVLLPLLRSAPRRADAAARADTLVCKVFLQHLGALAARRSFAALWARVVRAQRPLLAARAEPLREAALESLKNMLLVMHEVRIFSNADGYNELWYITWDIIGEFLPTLKDELFPEANDNARPPQTVPAHMQTALPASMPTLVPIAPTSMPTAPPSSPPTSPQNTNTAPDTPNPQTVPQQNSINTSAPLASNNGSIQKSPTPQSPPVQRSSAQSPNMLVAPVTSLASPPTGPQVTVASTLPPPAPVTAGTQSPPVSGMVPIRNQLYDQSGLTSSVLLQPLNEMISTPIGISLQATPMLVPRPVQIQQTTEKPHNNEIERNAIEQTQNVTNSNSYDNKDIYQSELYAEYLTNPYNEAKQVSPKEATLYDPVERHATNDQTVPDSESTPIITQKSYSANATPMHTVNKAQFASTDNVRRESSMFNFASYFGPVNETLSPGSEVFDTLMTSQEG